MLVVKIALAAGAIWSVSAFESGMALAQATQAAATPAQGIADLPKRRPEEARADPMQAFDINKNGRLELAEVKSAAAARFDELNPDQDDKLDAAEAGSILQGEAFRRADTDQDGTVDKAEYLEYVEHMFELANPDKDGSLDLAELKMNAGQALLALVR